MPRPCTQCHAQIPDNDSFCTSCGSAQPVGGPAPAAGGPTGAAPTAVPGPTGPAPTAMHGSTGAVLPPAPVGGGATPGPAAGTGIPHYEFKVDRWSVADRITGIATAILLISLFLPWFGFSAGYEGSFTMSGISAHGYLYIVLFVCLAILVYLGGRAGWDRLPVNVNVAHAPVMVVATAFNLVLVLIGVLLKPTGLDWEVGAWFALIAAIVAVAPIAVPAIQARTGGR